jgi:hypothetical protein
VVPLVIASIVAVLSGYLLSANYDRLPLGRSSSNRVTDAARAGRASSATHAPAVQPAGLAEPAASEPQEAAAQAAREPATPAADPDAEPSRAARRREQATPASREAAVPREASNAAASPREPASQPAIAPDVPEALITVPGSEGSSASPTTPDPSNAVDEVSGSWNVTTHVESSSVEAFKDLTLGFSLQLEQRGNRVIGSGYKVSEAGEPIPSTSRTPIAIEGTIDGSRLALNFTEQGSRRTSSGRFVFYLNEDGTLRGRFRSDAAQSSGTSVATRESPARD